jgi:hypothetical protein
VEFHEHPGRRDYVFLVQLGDKVREYVVSIGRDAFVKRKALLQDGPDICYRKLVRELVDTDLTGSARLGVTDADLASYREAHAPPARRPHPRRIDETVAGESDEAEEKTGAGVGRVL